MVRGKRGKEKVREEKRASNGISAYYSLSGLNYPDPIYFYLSVCVHCGVCVRAHMYVCTLLLSGLWLSMLYKFKYL